MREFNKKWLWLLLPIFAILFVWMKWDAWFGNPVEPPYAPSPAPSRIMLTWSDDPYTSRDVTWVGDTLTRTGLLQLLSASATGDTMRYSSPATIARTTGGASSFFRVKMKDLYPGNAYRYRVANGMHWSAWFDMKIGKPTDPSFSFIYLGDVQDTIGGKTGLLFHKAYATKPDASFMLFIGDMIERPHDQYWNEFFKAGSGLFGAIPVIATPGNHEYHKALFPELDKRWMLHFSFPQNGPDGFLGRDCYWDFNNTRFISLDSNGIQSFPTAVNQRNWLKEVLTFNKQRWTVVIMHHPLYSTSTGRNYFYLKLLFKPLFDQYNVDLVLSGHDHVYGRAAHISKTGSHSGQGAVYVVSHASPKFYEIKFSEEMDQMASNTAMYQHVEVCNDSITLHTYTPDGALYDGFTIHKDAAGFRSITDKATPADNRFLMPSEKIIRRNSNSELKKFNQKRADWKTANSHSFNR